MRFTETPLAGAHIVEAVMHRDERGAFGRTFCEREFKEAGLATRFVQCNTSFNTLSGTVRGMHFQADPKPEAKLVRCTRGRIFDVIVDLRKNSKTYLKWFGAELSSENRTALFIPEGFAHGFQTLEDNSEVFYQMSEFYEPELATGVRFDDPLIQVRWPIDITQINPRDKEWPLINQHG